MGFYQKLNEIGNHYDNQTNATDNADWWSSYFKPQTDIREHHKIRND